jgi:Amt family ammonium transporter
MQLKSLLTAAILLAMPFSAALASEGLNSGDTAWMIVSTALVMMMTPAGLALFYGGMSRYKNLLNSSGSRLFPLSPQLCLPPSAP